MAGERNNAERERGDQQGSAEDARAAVPADRGHGETDDERKLSPGALRQNQHSGREWQCEPGGSPRSAGLQGEETADRSEDPEPVGVSDWCRLRARRPVVPVRTMEHVRDADDRDRGEDTEPERWTILAAGDRDRSERAARGSEMTLSVEDRALGACQRRLVAQSPANTSRPT
jgi:hypothetical protein